MKRTLFILVAILLLVGSSSASAMGLGGFASYADMKDLEDSYGFGGKIDVPLGLTFLFLEARGTFYPSFEKTILGEDLEISGFPLEFGTGIAFGNLFASAGVSYFMLNLDKGSMDDALGFYLAGGLWQNVQGIGLYVEGIYRSLNSTVEVDNDEISINKEDIDLNGFGINFGFKFTF